MLVLVVRGVIVLGVLGWYSATMWKMIDGYFKDQFRSYLQEEYRKYPRMRSDVVNVDKGPAMVALPTELSRVAETYGVDVVCPADIADTCPRATATGPAVEQQVTGGSSENAATGSTDKNAFPGSAARYVLEGRKLPCGSMTSGMHDEQQRPGAIINQDDDHDGKKEAIGGSDDGVLALSAAPSRPDEPIHRLNERRSSIPRKIAKKVSKISKRSTKRRVKTIVLTDFAAVKVNDDDTDFSEFEEENEENRRISKEGILVSELPFKPKADIGHLDRVTAEEFCPLTLEDEASCGETTMWP